VGVPGVSKFFFRTLIIPLILMHKLPPRDRLGRFRKRRTARRTRVVKRRTPRKTVVKKRKTTKKSSLRQRKLAEKKKTVARMKRIAKVQEKWLDSLALLHPEVILTGKNKTVLLTTTRNLPTASTASSPSTRRNNVPIGFGRAGARMGHGNGSTPAVVVRAGGAFGRTNSGSSYHSAME